MSSGQLWPASDQYDTSVSLRLEATTLAAVRQRARDLLAGRPGVLVEEAVQVTDELVSNAYRHGLPPRTVRLILTGGGRRLRIEVDDASPLQPMMRNPDRTGGLGIILIHRIASSWGVQRHDRHKTVWAEVELSGPDTNGIHLTVVPAGP